MSVANETELEPGDDPEQVLSADLTWRRWSARAGLGEWLAHLRPDKTRTHLASIEVIAPPGVPLCEEPYGDALLDWRRATWESLAGFLADKAPESEAEITTLNEVLDAVPAEFLDWMAESLETHADALEQLAGSQRLQRGAHFLSYACNNLARARGQRADAARLAAHADAEDQRGHVELLAPIGELLARRAAAWESIDDRVTEVYEDMATQIDLLASWVGSRERVHEQLLYAIVELARLNAIPFT